VPVEAAASARDAAARAVSTTSLGTELIITQFRRPV
jgi:hypothetical protein